MALLLFVFAAGLLVEGYNHGVLGESPQTASQFGEQGKLAPPALVYGGPVISAAGPTPYTYRMAPGTVALTFDDGPDSTWTPKILAILRRFAVPATFFAMGTHAASYPWLIRAELRQGDEVGSHTYTHVNLAATAGWRESLELTLTQNALAGAAGVRTNLLRPPYSSISGALTATDWNAYRQAARFGYLIVLANVDTKDWTRPGAAKIVANAMNHLPRGHGAIIMMHDSGGDRSQTVRALPQIITDLRSQGYRFVTVTEGLHLPTADVPATQQQRIVGTALVLTQQAADHMVAILAVGLVLASFLMAVRILALVYFARLHRRRNRRPIRPPRGSTPPGITSWASTSTAGCSISSAPFRQSQGLSGRSAARLSRMWAG